MRLGEGPGSKLPAPYAPSLTQVFGFANNQNFMTVRV